MEIFTGFWQEASALIKICKITINPLFVSLLISIFMVFDMQKKKKKTEQVMPALNVFILSMLYHSPDQPRN